MEILKFGDNPTPNRSNNNQRKPAAMIVAGVLVAMMGMSTTLAGTISIGTNSRVEFGQGVVATAACDSDVTITPVSSFDATGAGNSGNGTFTIETVTVSRLAGGSETGTANCLGKVLKLTAYDENDSVVTFNGQSTATLMIPCTGSDANTNTNYTKNNSSFTIQSASGMDGSSGIISLGFGTYLSNSVTRFTLESSDYTSGIVTAQATGCS